MSKTENNYNTLVELYAESKNVQAFWNRLPQNEKTELFKFCEAKNWQEVQYRIKESFLLRYR